MPISGPAGSLAGFLPLLAITVTVFAIGAVLSKSDALRDALHRLLHRGQQSEAAADPDSLVSNADTLRTAERNAALRGVDLSIYADDPEQP